MKQDEEPSHDVMQTGGGGISSVPIYYNQEAILSDIEIYIIPKLRETLDFKIVRAELLDLSKKVYPLITQFQENLNLMEDYISEIKQVVNLTDERHVKLYQSLADEVENCQNLPVIADGRWYSNADVLPNRKYICEFTELIGYLAHHPEEILH